MFDKLRKKIKMIREVGLINTIMAKVRRKEIKVHRELEKAKVSSVSKPVVIHVDTTEKEPKTTSTTRVYNKGGF